MGSDVRAQGFEFNLPIGCRDEEGGLQKTVVLRKMTGREEAILADRKYQRNGGMLVTELLNSCIVKVGNLEKNGRVMVSGMYSADRNYLLLKLRSITFGTDLQSSYICPSCNETVRLTEDLESLPVRFGNGDFSEDINVELEDGYMDKDDQVHTSMVLRLPTGKDEEAVASQMRQNPSLAKNALLARCLKSLGDVPTPRLEALGPKILADLTLSDRRLIDKAMNNGAPGVDLVHEVECYNCGHEFKATLDMTHFLALE